MSATADGRTLLIWDAPGDPPQGEWTTVLWRAFDSQRDANVISAPRMVEERADELRLRYLAWLHECGQAVVAGRRVVEHLEIRPGFSFWWMTLLAQKCTYARSPAIYQCMRLLALDGHRFGTPVTAIRVATENDALADALQAWASECGCRFQRVACAPERARGSLLARAIAKTPRVCRALAAITRFAWLRRGGGLQTAKPLQADGISVVDILTHLSSEAARDGEFKSGYWSALVGLVSAEHWQCNWLHFWHRSRVTPTVKSARFLTWALNASGTHALVDGAFGLQLFLRTVADYSRLVRCAIRLRGLACWRPAGSRVTFEPLLRSDWKDSLLGVSAATNLCYLNTIERFTSRMPRQRAGVFIQENQPWEIALIHAWRRAGHGTIIGTPHTTVRYWDLRYLYDPRTCAASSAAELLALPTPDVIAVNGPAALAALGGGLAPEDRLHQVEALRYLHLAAANDGHARAHSDRLVLLVTTDLLDSNTRQQMSFVEAALAALPESFTVIVKPHPASDFSVQRFPQWQSRVDRSELGQLIARADIVFSSNASSAAIDAHLAGKRVLTLLDGERFNFSPLRGSAGNAYVASGEDLIAQLKGFLASASGASSAVQRAAASEYFHLDPGLPRWRALLSRALA